MSRRLNGVRLAMMMFDGLGIAQRAHVLALGITSDGVKIRSGCGEARPRTPRSRGALLVRRAACAVGRARNPRYRLLPDVIDAAHWAACSRLEPIDRHNRATLAARADERTNLRKLVYYVAVFSTTMGQSPDPTVELVAADPSHTARRLKAEEGLDIWIVGGGKLAHSLLPEIDRLILKQNASVIGSGIPMFDGPFQPQLFRPTDLRQLDPGIRILSFDRL